MVKATKNSSSPKRAAQRVQTTKIWRQLNLREWMVYRNNMTAEALAEKTGLSEGLISQILSNKSGGSPGSIQRIAEALECTVGELFDVKPEPGGRMIRVWVDDKDRPTIEAIIAARSLIKD